MGLVPLAVVTVTLTIPPFMDEPAGEVAVRLASELALTFVAGLLPNKTVKPLTEKPDPVMTTGVPPAIGPLDGLRLLMVGGGSYV